MAEENYIQELSHSESMGASLASADFNLLKHSVLPIYNEGNKAVVDAQREKKSLPALSQPQKGIQSEKNTAKV